MKSVKELGIATTVAWTIVVLQFIYGTDATDIIDIALLYFLSFGALAFLVLTIISWIIAVLSEPAVEISKEVGRAGKKLYGIWSKMTPEEHDAWKQTGRRAGKNFDEVKNTKKSWVSGIIDTFL